MPVHSCNTFKGLAFYIGVVKSEHAADLERVQGLVRSLGGKVAKKYTAQTIMLAHPATKPVKDTTFYSWEYVFDCHGSREKLDIDNYAIKQPAKRRGNSKVAYSTEDDKELVRWALQHGDTRPSWQKAVEDGVCAGHGMESMRTRYRNHAQHNKLVVDKAREELANARQNSAVAGGSARKRRQSAVNDLLPVKDVQDQQPVTQATESDEEYLSSTQEDAEQPVTQQQDADGSDDMGSDDDLVAQLMSSEQKYRASAPASSSVGSGCRKRPLHTAQVHAPKRSPIQRRSPAAVVSSGFGAAAAATSGVSRRARASPGNIVDSLGGIGSTQGRASSPAKKQAVNEAQQALDFLCQQTGVCKEVATHALIVYSGNASLALRYLHREDVPEEEGHAWGVDEDRVLQAGNVGAPEYHRTLNAYGPSVCVDRQDWLEGENSARS